MNFHARITAVAGLRFYINGGLPGTLCPTVNAVLGARDDKVEAAAHLGMVEGMDRPSHIKPPDLAKSTVDRLVK